jgi:uncharacterized repeat protein (TIGR01451 family)
MKTTKTLVIAALFSILCSLFPAAVHAADCTNQYGSSVDCPSNQLYVNKTVRDPITMTKFWENITSNHTPYSVGAEVEYDIAVTNQSNVTFSTVTVTDILPTGLVFKAGPGSYNASTNTLTYTLTNLGPGSANTVHSRFTATVKDASFFGNVELICDGPKVNNYVKVVGPNGQTNEDNASLCVQTKVLGVSSLPVAGFEDYIYILPFALSGLVGVGLMVKGRKKQQS